MNNIEQSYQRIDDYLNGRMNQQELNAFEQELQQNAELRDMLELEQATNEAIFQNSLVDIRSEFANEMEGVRKTRKVKTIAITAAAFLLGLGTVLLFNNKGEKTGPGIPLKVEEETLSLETIEETPSANIDGENITPAVAAPETEVSEVSSFNKPTAEVDETESRSVETSNPNEVTKPEITPENQTDQVVISTPTTSSQESRSIGTSQTKPTPCPVITISNKQSFTVCEGETGSFTVKAQGGISPYTYEFDGQTYTSAYINSIYSGEYELIVTDAKECRSKAFPISITEKKCFTPEKAFTPANGNWTYDSDGEEINLKILNSRGQLVFESHDIDPSWNGQNNNGEQMPRDAYIYIVEFENGTSLTGTVTLVP